MPLTDAGFEPYRTADQLDLIRDALDEELASRGFTGSIDYERDTFMGAVTAVMADRLGRLGELAEAVYDARDPNNATGVQLSSLALAVGITRNEPTYSTVTITIGGDSGTVIPSGKTVRGGGVDGDALWDSTVDATIPGGGFVDVLFQAQERAATQAPAGTSWEVVTPVTGWSTTTNTADASVGDARETDDELRVRRQESLQIGGSASARAIRAQLLEVSGVTAAIVLENFEPYVQVVEGLSMGPYSVGCVVFPSSLTIAQRIEVARTIYENISVGIQTSGSVLVLVEGLDIVQKEIWYSYPAEFDIEVDIAVEMEPATASNPDPPAYADVEPLVKAAAVAYGLTLDPGDDVRKLPLYGDIDAIEGVRSVVVTYTSPVDPSKVQATGDVLILAAEIAIILEADVTVHQV